MVGEKFEIEASLENLSFSGLCASLDRQVDLEEEILFHVHFSDEQVPAQRWPRIAAHGWVIRSVERPDGAWETAVKFADQLVF